VKRTEKKGEKLKRRERQRVNSEVDVRKKKEKKKRRTTVLLLRRFGLRCSSATRATASSQPHHRDSASAGRRCSSLHPPRRVASRPKRPSSTSAVADLQHRRPHRPCSPPPNAAAQRRCSCPYHLRSASTASASLREQRRRPVDCCWSCNPKLAQPRDARFQIRRRPVPIRDALTARLLPVPAEPSPEP